MWMVLLASLARAGDLPDNAGARAAELASALVHQCGRRPTGERAAECAQLWVERALTERGWPARRLRTWPGAVFGCQSGAIEDGVLFLAHTDSVPTSPGANDNASSVGVLLAAAELLRGVSTPRRVCLAFPDGEEIGLRGSYALANATDAPLGGPVNQAMALEMVGVGRPRHHGLGPPFGEARLRALLAAAPLDAPWASRALSTARPSWERSDHHAWNLRGTPASLLFGSGGPHGFDPAYHTALDTPARLEPDALQVAVRTVVAVALAPPLPAEPMGRPAAVLPWLGWVLPGWATWLLIGASPVAVALGALRPRIELREALEGALAWTGHAIVASLALGLTLLVASRGTTLGDAGLDPAVLAGWAAWGAVALGAPVEAPPAVARTMGGLVALGLMAAALAGGAPLAALPLAVAASAIGCSRWLPQATALAAIPALYLFRPDAIRQLAFHQLVPADALWWSVGASLLLLPVLGGLSAGTGERRRQLAALLVVAAVAGVVASWLIPQMPGAGAVLTLPARPMTAP